MEAHPQPWQVNGFSTKDRAGRRHLILAPTTIDRSRSESMTLHNPLWIDRVILACLPLHYDPPDLPPLKRYSSADRRRLGWATGWRRSSSDKEAHLSIVVFAPATGVLGHLNTRAPISAMDSCTETRHSCLALAWGLRARWTWSSQRQYVSTASQNCSIVLSMLRR